MVAAVPFPADVDMTTSEPILDPGSGLPPGLIRAYLDTHYHVEGESPFILRVGRPSPGLLSLYRRQGRSTACYLTAWNPLGQAVAEADNAASQAELAAAIAHLGLPVLPGSGRAMQGGWPPEPSLLVLGMTLEEGKALGIRFRQNAFLWCDEAATPHLVLLR